MERIVQSAGFMSWTGPTRPMGMGGNHHDQLFATGLSFSERMRLPSVVVTSTSRTLRPFASAPVAS